MTRGRINAGTSKKVLVSIVFGALYFGSPTPPTPSNVSGDGGIGIAQKLPSTHKIDTTWYYDEQDIVTIIKIWTKING